MCISPDDPEVKKNISAITTQTRECFSLPDRLKYFSSWHKAKRAVAVCLSLQRKYRTGSEGRDMVKTKESKQRKTGQYIPVNTEELQDAETEIRLLCSNNLQHGSHDRTSARVMRKTCNLSTLDLFLDENGVLRVGGRLKHADLSTAAKYPAILPKKGHMTDLIISHCHDSVEHQGRGMAHNKIRSSGFWIIGASSAVSDYIAKCVCCRKLRGAVQEQKMADLPEDRVQSAPPFSYCTA